MPNTAIEIQYVDSLVAIAMQHKVVSHPYLDGLKNGLFPNMKFAFNDFAWQYFHYSLNFSRFLRGALEQLSQSDQRDLIKENLQEECGLISSQDLSLLEKKGIKAEWVSGIPHTELFQRFLNSVMTETRKTFTPPPKEAVLWSQQFQNLCTNQGIACALGALGLGTELIVKPIYLQILEGIKKHTSCSVKERVFFELHAVLDEQHAATIKHVLANLQTKPLERQQMRYGMTKALDLRCKFFDSLLVRAKNPKSIVF